MSSVSLGLDLDGVCADYETAFRSYVSRALGVAESTLGPQTAWSFVQSGWLASEEQFLQLHADAVRDGLFRSMPMMPGASQRLWQLSDAGVHIRVITHRLCVNWAHAFAASDTVLWLDKHNIPYRDLCFQKQKPLVGADIYLDDAPHNIEALRAAGAYAIVFDAGYNRHVPGPRARDWDEATDLILARKARIDAGEVPPVAA